MGRGLGWGFIIGVWKSFVWDAFFRRLFIGLFAISVLACSFTLSVVGLLYFDNLTDINFIYSTNCTTVSLPDLINYFFDCFNCFDCSNDFSCYS